MNRSGENYGEATDRTKTVEGATLLARPFRSDAREAAMRSALWAARHIDEHEARIERQKLLVADLRKDGHEVMAKEAERPIVLLFKMYDDLRHAYERFDSSSG